MELNFTPVRTSKNYGINSINIEDNLQKSAILAKNIKNNVNSYLKFENFTILNDESVTIDYLANIQNENILNQDIKAEAELHSNFNLSANIEKSSKTTTEFCFNFDKDNSNLIDVINLNVKDGVNSNIIFKYTSSEEIEAYHNLHLKINVGANSNINIIFYSNLSEKSTNLISIQSDLQKYAKLDINFIDFACKNSIYNYNSKILGENSESNIKSLYLGNGDSIIDLNYLVDIYERNSKTNMEILGAISDNTRKHFKGTIDFKKGCCKSVGSENEFCMLLSSTAKSKALPMLLCNEEDVDGKHSSSTGKVSEKELFYVMSRGLSKAEATRLIVKAKFNNIISSLFDENLKEIVLDNIDRKIK